jgi:hypothetical protein
VLPATAEGGDEIDVGAILEESLHGARFRQKFTLEGAIGSNGMLE